MLAGTSQSSQIRQEATMTRAAFKKAIGMNLALSGNADIWTVRCKSCGRKWVSTPAVLTSGHNLCFFLNHPRRCRMLQEAEAGPFPLPH